MDRSFPRAIADLLPAALPQLGDRLAEHRLVRTWAALVGADVARRTRPGAVVAGTLTVVVDNSPWLAELTLRADDLRARIAAQFPEVQALRFTLGTLEPAADAATAPRTRPAQALTPADRAEIDAATAAIGDPQLAEAARRLMTKALRFPFAKIVIVALLAAGCATTAPTAAPERAKPLTADD